MGTVLSSDISKYQHVDDSIMLYLGVFPNFLLTVAFELKKTKIEKELLLRETTVIRRIWSKWIYINRSAAYICSFSGQSTDVRFTVLRSLGKNIAWSHECFWLPTEENANSLDKCWLASLPSLYEEGLWHLTSDGTKYVTLLKAFFYSHVNCWLCDILTEFLLFFWLGKCSVLCGRGQFLPKNPQNLHTWDSRNH